MIPAHLPHELSDAASLSVEVDRASILLSDAGSATRVDVVYTFRAEGRPDGKPVFFDLVSGALTPLGVDGIGVSIGDPGSPTGRLTEETKLVEVMLEPGESWEGSSVAFSMQWPGEEASALRSGVCLVCPDQLPQPLLGTEAIRSRRTRLPILDVAFAGKEWDGGIGGVGLAPPFPSSTPYAGLLQAIAHQSDRSSTWSVRQECSKHHTVICTPGLFEEWPESALARARLSTIKALKVVERIFELEVAANVLLVAPELFAGGGSAYHGSVLNPERLLRMDLATPEAFGTLCALVSRIWWGIGLQVAGPWGRELERAVQIGIQWWVVAARYPGTEYDREVIDRLTPPPDDDPLASTTNEIRFRAAWDLGMSLYRQLRGDELLRETLRILTRSSWAMRIPEDLVFDTLRRAGVEVPAGMSRTPSI